MNVFVVYLFLGALFVLVLSEKEKDHKNHLQEIHYKRHQRSQGYLDRAESQGHHGHRLQGFRHRAGNQEERCQWVCLPNSTNTSTPGFQLFYNGTSSLIATLSKQANVAIIIDYSSNLIAFLNGASGEAIIINLTTRTTYRIKYNSEDGSFLWLVSQRSFETYFQNVSSLQRLYQIAESRGQKLTSLNEIRYILAQFGVSPTEAFSYLISFALHLHGHLRLLFHGNGSIRIPQDLQWFLSVSNAFGSLLNNAQGNLTNLERLDLNKIFRSGSGIEALYNFLYQIGEHSNLAELFEGYLRNPHKFLELFEQLSGESHYGFDGLLNIIVNIIKELQGHGSFSKIFSSILNYNATSNEGNASFRTIVERFLKLAESQLQRYGNNTGLQNFIKFLESLNNNNFTFNNVNISDIIKLLRSYNPAEAFSTISRIIARFSPSHAIPQFFRFILNVLNNTNSVEDIRKILPHSINLRNFTSGAESILHQITQGRNLTGLLSGGSCPNSSVLSRIPVIGHIIEEFTKSFQNASTPFDINQLFNASYIQDILTGKGGIREGVSNTTKFISNSQHGFENVFHKIVSGFENTAHRFGDDITSFLGGSSSDHIRNNASVINSTESSISGSGSSYNTSSGNNASESGRPESSTSTNFGFGNIDFIGGILGNGDSGSGSTINSGSKNFSSETVTYGYNNSEGGYIEARANHRRSKHFQE